MKSSIFGWIEFGWILQLLWIGFSDYRERKIKNKQVVGVLIFACIRMFCFEQEKITVALLGVLVAFGVFFVILLFFPGAFGGGDVKLSMANGLYLGSDLWMKGFAMAIILATGYILLSTRKGEKMREKEIAFGPFLCAGAILVKMWTWR